MNEKLQYVVDTLEGWADDQILPRDKSVGICWNLKLLPCGVWGAQGLVTEAARSWPESSGSLGYPVPHPEMSALIAYESPLTKDKWIGEYGAARRRLCQHIANWCRANPTWALYFSKYFTAYKKEGINIWGITVENEPHGNGNNWESMLFTPKEMTDFVELHLGPRLAKDGYGKIKILGYDQNRAGLKEWVDEMYRSKKSSKYFAGTAMHWYESTYDYFGEALQYAHKKNPAKYLINTEACIDAEVPKWKDDDWYWKQEATDWGWDWASEKEKYLHPKYVPAFRYARDIIGCLNNYVDGWIDWNMVLDKQGGPNWFKNWCIAPVIVDTATDEVYFTPLYYVMAHFSKFIRPGAIRVGCMLNHKELMASAVKNPDGTIAVIIFNPTESAQPLEINLNNKKTNISISAKALQTVVIKS